MGFEVKGVRGFEPRAVLRPFPYGERLVAAANGSGESQRFVRSLDRTASDPVLELHRGSPVIAKIDDWGETGNSGNILGTSHRIGASLFAGGDAKSSALLITLNPGAYTPFDRAARRLALDRGMAATHCQWRKNYNRFTETVSRRVGWL